MESVAVEIKPDRGDLASDAGLPRMAEVVNAQPGWRLDVIILGAEPVIAKATRRAAEPTDDQLAQILRSAKELTDNGHAPYAHVIAWSGLEAAMRRVQTEAELHGQPTPVELMRALYGNGFLDPDQFRRRRESYKVRSQVVHGLIPPPVAPELVRFVSATARSLARVTP